MTYRRYLPVCRRAVISFTAVNRWTPLMSSPKVETSESLADLIEQINEAFREVDSSRVRAGLLLIEARTCVEAAGQRWTKWVAANIERSMRDVQRCMKLARADDPAAAAEAERAKNRTAVAAHRARDEATYVSRQTDDSPVDLNGVKARIGKSAIDLSALSADAQAQIIKALHEAEHIDEDEDEGEGGFNLLANMGGAGGNVRHSHCEWWTPRWVFERLGNPQFDLDPASHPGAAANVPATRYLTREDDGLAVGWEKNFVWMNPPFGERNGMHGFIDKFIQHANGIVLLPAYPNNPWFHRVVSEGDATLFVGPKRIEFINGGGEDGKSAFAILGAMLVALGKRAVDVLRTGARNGFGILMVPDRGGAIRQPTLTIEHTSVALLRKPEPVARSSRQLVCALAGKIGCQSHRLCHKEGRCREVA